MARRRAGELPIEEAAAIDRFLRELRRELPEDWMTGGTDPAPRPVPSAGGFWAETDEDYGIGPDGRLIGPPEQPAWPLPGR